MGYTTYSLGLTIKQPTRGTRGYYSTLDQDTYTKISQHNHTGSGMGAQIGTAALVADSVTEAKVRLANAGWLRSRNAADSGDLNLVRADSSNILRFANVGANTRADLGLGPIETSWSPAVTGSGTLVLASIVIVHSIYTISDPWVFFQTHITFSVSSGTGNEIFIPHPVAGVAQPALTFNICRISNAALTLGQEGGWNYDGTKIRAAGFGGPNFAVGATVVAIDGKYRRI